MVDKYNLDGIYTKVIHGTGDFGAEFVELRDYEQLEAENKRLKDERITIIEDFTDLNCMEEVAKVLRQYGMGDI